MSNAGQPSETAPRDCLVGVCAAIGEDFGFNPDILRIPFAALLLWNPLILAAAYTAAGLLVLLSRRLFPRPSAAPTVETDRPSRCEVETEVLREAA